MLNGAPAARDVKIGSMFMYEATEEIVIDTVGEYQAVTGFSVGENNTGFTFLESATGVITDTETSGGLLRCTDVGHGLSTGQYISLHGMGDVVHSDHTRVTVITEDVFDCDNISYNSDDDTGNWTRGSSLTVDAGGDGFYTPRFGGSIFCDGSNKNYRIELAKNLVHLDEFVAERKISIQNDLGQIANGGPVYLVVGDVVWMQVKGTTDNTDITFEHANVSLTRI